MKLKTSTKWIIGVGLFLMIVVYGTYGYQPFYAQVEYVKGPAKTQHDLSKLPNVKLEEPTTDPATPMRGPVEFLKSDLPGYKKIEVEYQLLTDTKPGTIKPDALQKNPNLLQGVNKVPVYLIAFSGIDYQAADGSTGHEKLFVVDANSGELMYEMSYR